MSLQIALAATAGALPTNTYTAGSGATPDSITMSANGSLSVDGYTVAFQDSVLVKDESTAAHNGWYSVAVAGDGSHQAVLHRQANYDSQYNQLVIQVVNNGTVNPLSQWILKTTGSVNGNGVSTGADMVFLPLIPGGNLFSYALGQTVFGVENTCNNDESTAIGYENTANGEGAVAVGFENDANGQGAVAIGFGCSADNHAVAVGYQVSNQGNPDTAEFGYGINKIHLGGDRIDGCKGYLNGMTLSNNATTPNTKIDVAAGNCGDSTGELYFYTSATTTGVDIGSLFGSGGNLFTGTVAASTVYHVFAIRKDSDASIAFGFDTDVGCAHIPAGYTYFRRLGSVITDGSSHIRAFHQHGNEFIWDTSIKDIDVTNPGTSAVTRTLTVPTGVQVQAIFTSVSYDSVAYVNHYVSALESADEAPAYVNAIESGAGDAGQEGVGNNRIWTNTSAQVRSRLSTSSANTAFKIRTRGWVDLRGQ